MAGLYAHISFAPAQAPLSAPGGGEGWGEVGAAAMALRYLVPGLLPELLPEQRLHIRLIVHHQQQQQQPNAHARPPSVANIRRGKVMTNSVNAPTSLSTVIVPPCCCVTMSYAIDSPSPVPSPVGLVVKNG